MHKHITERMPLLNMSDALPMLVCVAMAIATVIAVLQGWSLPDLPA